MHGTGIDNVRSRLHWRGRSITCLDIPCRLLAKGVGALPAAKPIDGSQIGGGFGRIGLRTRMPHTGSTVSAPGALTTPASWWASWLGCWRERWSTMASPQPKKERTKAKSSTPGISRGITKMSRLSTKPRNESRRPCRVVAPARTELLFRFALFAQRQENIHRREHGTSPSSRASAIAPGIRT